MDTSETYIKMCEKAEEIQGLRPMSQRWEMGDYVSEGYTRWTIAEGKMGRCFADIWLPRQDQLQEMLPEYIAKSGFVPSLAAHFADFVCSTDLYPLPFTSFEQWWLAFVYKQKYNKVWNGEEWITS